MVLRKPGQELRFEKWQRLAPISTRVLSTLVASQLVPVLESRGFQRVGYSLKQPDLITSGRELELERWVDEFVDTVTFNFDKYGAPRFQVHVSRRASEFPHNWVRAANLVRRSNQFLHFWGKPWWLPSYFWSEQASCRVVAQVQSMIPSALAFVEQGECNGSISRRAS